ncbi:thioredoxin domain-containing protein [Streptomyces albicerus]|uniref:alkylmercury lyase n=1 Tax=Streptomyces albicerus TaxID=2569859 RepID=UPI00124BAD30|nr:alkylmercury lyase [Streptomyces albicerus]
MNVRDAGVRDAGVRDAGIRITVLAVPGCPNVPVVRERIAAAREGHAVAVEFVEVSDEATATRWHMTGSPTLLLDGVDPFAVPGAGPSLSCRLYRHTDGTTDGAPSEADLRRVLAASGPAGTTSKQR